MIPQEMNLNNMKEDTNKSIIPFHSQPERREVKDKGREGGGGGREVKFERIGGEERRVDGCWKRQR